MALADTLRNLRERVGFRTGKEFAAHIGWVASKVSHVENGRTLPSDADLAAWAAAVDADADTLTSLRDEARELRLDRDRWKRRLRHGHATVQRGTAVSERAASHITMVEFFLVPGLVQTPDYARRVFEIAAAMVDSPDDADTAVRERVRRQDVLYDPSRTVEILVSEAALRNPICSPEAMRGQLDRLTNLAGLGHVRLGVIPLDVQLPTITLHGYTILDDAVTVEVNHTDVTATDPDDVALYRSITDQLWGVAAEGDAARRVLTRVASDLPSE
ncbi:helix-turn-helix transcriptional regulator [Prauserella halophila]|uniref:Helix-turn-helix transcriptional regulator n=1 Tax=Prauserella halophila TaxID=185641 RepID=A0ABP4HB34_9PSEU